MRDHKKILQSKIEEYSNGLLPLIGEASKYYSLSVEEDHYVFSANEKVSFILAKEFSEKSYQLFKLLKKELKRIKEENKILESISKKLSLEELEFLKSRSNLP